MSACSLVLRMPPPGYHVNGINIHTVKGAEVSVPPPVVAVSLTVPAATNDKDKAQLELEEQPPPPVLDQCTYFAMTLKQSLLSYQYWMIVSSLQGLRNVNKKHENRKRGKHHYIIIIFSVVACRAIKLNNLLVCCTCGIIKYHLQNMSILTCLFGLAGPVFTVRSTVSDMHHARATVRFLCPCLLQCHCYIPVHINPSPQNNNTVKPCLSNCSVQGPITLCLAGKVLQLNFYP